jgi:hypothetical protein
MATRQGAWKVAVYTLIGTALGAAGGALYSSVQSVPESPFRSNEAGQAPAANALSSRTVDPILVIDSALCGLVLGAGAGALARRGGGSG